MNYISDSEGDAILGIVSCKPMHIALVLCDGIGIDVVAINRSSAPVSTTNKVLNLVHG